MSVVCTFTRVNWVRMSAQTKKRRSENGGSVDSNNEAKRPSVKTLKARSMDGSTISTVKMKLRSFLNKDDDQYTEWWFLPGVEAIVEELNNISQDSYLFFNFYIVSAFSHRETLPKINANLFYNIIRLVCFLYN